MEAYKKEFIQFMVRAGALLFGEFTTKSGRQSPYFINTGKYETGADIRLLGRFYADCVQSNIWPKEAGVLFGPAYKGIPLAVSTAAALSERGLNVSYAFNRKEIKDHGEGGAIVGHKLTKGDHVVIIEDVLTAGTAVREILPMLQAAQVTIDGLVISIDRMERGSDNRSAARALREDAGIPVYAIITVRDIIDALHNQPVDGKVVLDDATRERMEKYLEMYAA